MPGAAQRRRARRAPPISFGARNQAIRSTAPRCDQRAGEIRAALDEQRLDRPSPPGRRGPRRAARRASPCTSTTSTPAARSAVHARPASASAAAITTTGISPARCAPAPSRAAGGRRSRRPPAPAGAPARSRSRAVSWRIVGERRPQAHRRRRRCRRASGAPAPRDAGPEIQRLSPEAVAILPSRLVASLSVTSGRPVSAQVRKGAFSSAQARASAPSATATSTPAACSTSRPCARSRSSGSSNPITTRAHSGRHQRVGAGRRAPVVRAGLERADHGRPAGVVPGHRQGHRLGVRQPGALVPALGDDLAVAQHHGADQRVGAHPAAAVEGQPDGAGEGRPLERRDRRHRHAHPSASAASPA